MKNLNNMTGAELLNAYNTAATALDRKLVKRFSTKAAGLKRTAAILAELTPAPKKAPRAPKTINLEFTGQIEHALRPGSIRDRFNDLMTRDEGASMDELMAIVAAVDAERDNGQSGNERNRARSYVRIMHTYHGYGVKTLKSGNLVVVSSDDS